MQTKEALREMVDLLPEDKVEIALNFLEWLKGEGLTIEEIDVVKKGEKEIAEGRFIRWHDTRRQV